MTPTEKARRSDALHQGPDTRRVLCDMIANRESDLEELRAENDGLRNDADLLRAMLSQVQTEKRCHMAENAKLRELCSELLRMAESNDPDFLHWPEISDELRKLGVKVVKL